MANRLGGIELSAFKTMIETPKNNPNGTKVEVKNE
jgi:hypothetical protein